MENSNSTSSPPPFSMVPGVSNAPTADVADVLSSLLMESDRRNIDLAYQHLSSASPLYKTMTAFSPDLTNPLKSSEGIPIVPEVSGTIPERIPLTLPQLVSKKRKVEGKSEIKAEEDPPSTPQRLENFHDGNSGVTVVEKALSPDDVKQDKRQKRLAKNREAAQQFRQRQKDYIAKLENRANELTFANHEASARVELLTSENKLMREQLVYLRNFMKQAVSISFPFGVPLHSISYSTSSSTSSTSSTSSDPMLALPSPSSASSPSDGNVPGHNEDLYPD